MSKELQKFTQQKEKAELFLANLEKLKSEGLISDSQYSILKADYTATFDSAVAKINSIYQVQQDKVNEIYCSPLRQGFD